MAFRFIMPVQQVFQDDGEPLSYAKLYFYETGTSTPKDTYSDDTYADANSNPIIADAAGRFIANIFLDTSAGRYRVVLKDQNDVTIWTKDNVGSATPTSIKGGRKGAVWFFSGTKQELDSHLLDGWYICDGTNLTPDMRQKYLKTCATVGAIGGTGGNNTVTPTATVGSTVLSVAQLPSHNHVPDATPPYVLAFNNDPFDIVASQENTYRFDRNQRTRRSTMASIGGNQGHSHDISVTSVSNEPPYYYLIPLRFGG